MAPADNRAELQRLLAAARRHVELERAFGVHQIPFQPARVQALSRKRRPTPSRGTGDTAAQKAARLRKLREEMGACSKCGLAESRTRLVFGAGNPDADLMFIGEAPGYNEDQQGIPFIGAAGQLLTRIIEAIGLTRDRVFIGNVLKCRPPNNRTPLPDQVAACLPHLLRQIDIIQPAIIVTLGNPATQAIVRTTEGITKVRGRFVDWNGIRVMPTFHPSYLLRNPAGKADVWSDMKKVWALMKELGLPVGELKRGRR